MRTLMITSVIAITLLSIGPFPAAAAATADSPSAAEIQSLQDKQSLALETHLAGMKGALRLTDDQMKLWPAFEAAIRDAAKGRWSRTLAARDRMSQGVRPTPIERMKIMADHLEKSASDLRKVADAGQLLFDSLDDAQKTAFGPLMREFKPNAHR